MSLAGVMVVALATLGVVSADSSHAQTIYANDFETPNQVPVRNCGFALDATPINTMYGVSGFLFQQTNTVETVLVDDPIYTDPLGRAGNLSIGMLSAAEDDLLALTFDALGRSFIQVESLISSIDVDGCGGPFGVSAPRFRLSLYDTPGGAFSFGAPGSLLDEAECVGRPAPDGFTFEWRYCGVALNAEGSGDGTVTLVWDLLESGYASFDNLEISATDVPTPTDRTTWAELKTTF